MGKNKKQQWAFHLILALVTLSWGFNNISIKIGVAHVTAGQFGSIRLLMAFPFLLLLTFCLPNRIPFEKRDFLMIALNGVIGMGLFQVLYIVGVAETSAPLGGILMATMPIHVVILSILFRLEKPHLRSIAGILLTVVGLVVLTLTGSNSNGAETTLRGILFIVIAELGYAINSTFLRPYMHKYPPLQISGLAMGTSVFVYLGVYYKGLLTLNWSALPPSIWIATAYSGLIALVASNLLWNIAIKHIGSTQVSVYANLAPVFVIILSAIIFKEVLNGWQLVGSVIILAGVVLVQVKDTVELSEAVRS
jgi:drug/metabolite transporter (DMT)-like permease